MTELQGEFSSNDRRTTAGSFRISLTNQLEALGPASDVVKPTEEDKITLNSSLEEEEEGDETIFSNEVLLARPLHPEPFKDDISLSGKKLMERKKRQQMSAARQKSIHSMSDEEGRIGEENGEASDEESLGELFPSPTSELDKHFRSQNSNQRNYQSMPALNFSLRHGADMDCASVSGKKLMERKSRRESAAAAPLKKRLSHRNSSSTSETQNSTELDAHLRRQKRMATDTPPVRPPSPSARSGDDSAPLVKEIFKSEHSKTTISAVTLDDDLMPLRSPAGVSYRWMSPFSHSSHTLSSQTASTHSKISALTMEHDFAPAVPKRPDSTLHSSQPVLSLPFSSPPDDVSISAKKLIEKKQKRPSRPQHGMLNKSMSYLELQLNSLRGGKDDTDGGWELVGRDNNKLVKSRFDEDLSTIEEWDCHHSVPRGGSSQPDRTHSLSPERNRWSSGDPKDSTKMNQKTYRFNPSATNNEMTFISGRALDFGNHPRESDTTEKPGLGKAPRFSHGVALAKSKSVPNLMAMENDYDDGTTMEESVALSPTKDRLESFLMRDGLSGGQTLRKGQSVNDDDLPSLVPASVGDATMLSSVVPSTVSQQTLRKGQSVNDDDLPSLVPASVGDSTMLSSVVPSTVSSTMTSSVTVDFSLTENMLASTSDTTEHMTSLKEDEELEPDEAISPSVVETEKDDIAKLEMSMPDFSAWEDNDQYDNAKDDIGKLEMSMPNLPSWETPENQAKESRGLVKKFTKQMKTVGHASSKYLGLSRKVQRGRNDSKDHEGRNESKDHALSRLSQSLSSFEFRFRRSGGLAQKMDKVDELMSDEEDEEQLNGVIDGRGAVPMDKHDKGYPKKTMPTKVSLTGSSSLHDPNAGEDVVALSSPRKSSPPKSRTKPLIEDRTKSPARIRRRRTQRKPPSCVDPLVGTGEKQRSRSPRNVLIEKRRAGRTNDSKSPSVHKELRRQPSNHEKRRRSKSAGRGKSRGGHHTSQNKSLPELDTSKESAASQCSPSSPTTPGTPREKQSRPKKRSSSSRNSLHAKGQADTTEEDDGSVQWSRTSGKEASHRTSAKKTSDRPSRRLGSSSTRLGKSLSTALDLKEAERKSPRPSIARGRTSSRRDIYAKQLNASNKQLSLRNLYVGDNEANKTERDAAKSLRRSAGTTKSNGPFEKST